jgi:hypothetical protein
METGYNALVDFFKTHKKEACDDPGQLIDKLIKNQSFYVRGIIYGVIKTKGLETNISKINQNLLALKTNPAFINQCRANSAENATRLALMVMEQIFSTPGVSSTVSDKKAEFNDFKKQKNIPTSESVSGGGKRKTRKRKTRRSKTYRRRH